MMIRSAPPASANLAEMPVPAPAPMMGLPCAICACSRSSTCARVYRIAFRPSSLVRGASAPQHLEQRAGGCPGKRLVVDVDVQLVDRDVARNVLPDRVEQRLVGF